MIRYAGASEYDLGLAETSIGPGLAKTGGALATGAFLFGHRPLFKLAKGAFRLTGRAGLGLAKGLGRGTMGAAGLIRRYPIRAAVISGTALGAVGVYKIGERMGGWGIPLNEGNDGLVQAMHDSRGNYL